MGRAPGDVDSRVHRSAASPLAAAFCRGVVDDRRAQEPSVTMDHLGQMLATHFMPHGTCYLWNPGLIALRQLGLYWLVLNESSVERSGGR